MIYEIAQNKIEPFFFFFANMSHNVFQTVSDKNVSDSL